MANFDPATRRKRAPYLQIEQLGLALPPPRPPVSNYRPAVVEGNLVYLSGQGPVTAAGHVYRGKVGSTLSIEEAYTAAQVTALNLLAALDQAIGDLSQVRRIVKVLGMINAGPDFAAHPQVINGCSDLLVAVFGPETGAHARSAIGVGSLPMQIAVEIEMIVAI